MSCFYCIKCGQLTGIDRARTLFRTGYFRVEYRLGCCTSCFPDPIPCGSPSASAISS